MPLPISWVDHLFAKLSVRYGAAFLRQWPDANPTMVKADWAEVLDGVSGDSLSYALRYLPSEPPNALQFRDLCRRAPPPGYTALPAPQPDRPPPSVGALVARLKGPRGNEAQLSIDNIERIVRERGGRISDMQRARVAWCLRTPGTSTTLGIKPALGPAGHLDDEEHSGYGAGMPA